MFQRKWKRPIETNLATKRKANQSFSVPEKATARKNVKGDTKKFETGYLKDKVSEKTEDSSWSSTEEMRDTDIGEETNFLLFADALSENLVSTKNVETAEEPDFVTFEDFLSQNLISTQNPEFNVQSFTADFKPIAKSTPIKDLEIEPLTCDFTEEAEQSGEDFGIEELTSIVEDLQPIILSEQFHISDLIDNTASINGEDRDTEDQNLRLDEEYSASKTLKNFNLSNKKVSKTKFSLGSQKKNQSSQRSRFLKVRNQISDAKTKIRQSNSSEHNSKEHCRNFSPISSKNATFVTTSRKTLFKETQDPNTQPHENDSAPRKKKSIKKNRTNIAKDSRTEDRSHKNVEEIGKLKGGRHAKKDREGSAEIYSRKSNRFDPSKTRNQRQSHLAENDTHAQTEESQNYCPTSSKDSGTTRIRSFKTLGYCPLKEGEKLPICFLTTVKDRLHLG